MYFIFQECSYHVMCPGSFLKRYSKTKKSYRPRRKANYSLLYYFFQDFLCCAEAGPGLRILKCSDGINCMVCDSTQVGPWSK